jgi:nucleotide-binding universal stress UspA family protein
MANALSLPGELPPSFDDEIRTSARTMLSEVKSQVSAAFPMLTVETVAVRRTATEALEDASTRSLLTVLGSTGHGEFAATVLGSVALYLSAHARGPVVVVRGDQGAPARVDGPVLVCVDGSVDPEGLLPFAFDQAALHGRELIAVHSFSEDVPTALVWPYAQQLRHERSAQEHTYLDSRLAGWSEKFPGVKITRKVLNGRAATAVLRYVKSLPESAKPSLIVVGTRGLGGVAGLLFGSTSHTLLTHAPCPVAVIPNTDGDGDSVAASDLASLR